MVGTFQLNVSQIPASLFSLPLSCPSFLSFARTKSCLLNFSNTLCLFDPSTCLELQKKLGKWHCELYISPGRGGRRGRGHVGGTGLTMNLGPRIFAWKKIKSPLLLMELANICCSVLGRGPRGLSGGRG